MRNVPPGSNTKTKPQNCLPPACHYAVYPSSSHVTAARLAQAWKRQRPEPRNLAGGEHPRSGPVGSQSARSAGWRASGLPPRSWRHPGTRSRVASASGAAAMLAPSSSRSARARGDGAAPATEGGVFQRRSRFENATPGRRTDHYHDQPGAHQLAVDGHREPLAAARAQWPRRARAEREHERGEDIGIVADEGGPRPAPSRWVATSRLASWSGSREDIAPRHAPVVPRLTTRTRSAVVLPANAPQFPSDLVKPSCGTVSSQEAVRMRFIARSSKLIGGGIDGSKSHSRRSQSIRPTYLLHRSYATSGHHAGARAAGKLAVDHRYMAP